MKRRQFLQACAAFLAAKSVGADEGLFEPANRPVPGVTDIGSRKQAFLDDQLIFEASKIKPIMTSPELYAGNPVITSDRPWELGRGGVSYSGQSVLFDEEEKIFKMWYGASDFPNARRPWCYAVSEDGYHWEKPELGIYEFEGSKKNNIITTWGDPTYANVIKDPRDPDPARRYKAMGEYDGPRANQGGGAVVAFSPDGLHWTEYPGKVMSHGPDLGDGPTLMGWDPKIKKFVFWPRPGHGIAPEVYGMGHHRHIRSHGYTTSDDFIHWTPTRVMLTPDHDERFDHHYLTLTGCIDGEFYVGLNGMLETYQQTVRIYLMSSRDGFHWTWIDRKEPFLGRAEIGVGDGGQMPHSCPSGPIIHKGKVLIYYTAVSDVYYGKGKNPGPNRPTIALCTLPQDRWVGLTAGPYRATIVTHSLKFTGSKLLVDIEAGVHRQARRATPRFDECDVRLALEDQSGGQIEGFTIDRCQPLLTSGVHEINWRGADVGKLEGKPVRIRFEMRNAGLYTIQFV